MVYFAIEYVNFNFYWGGIIRLWYNLNIIDLGGKIMKKIIPILLIVIGVLFLLTPFISEQIIKNYSKSIMDEEIPREVLKANNDNHELEIEFDFSAVEDVDIKSIIKGSQNFNKDYVIGSIYIPDLDINLSIMKGLSDANLMAGGAATMKPEQSFGIGNYTLAGHRMKKKNLLFGSLMDIEIGNMVYVSDGEKSMNMKFMIL